MPEQMQERIFWVAWSQISGVGPVTLHRLNQKFGSLAVAWQAPPTALSEVEGLGHKIIASIMEQRSRIYPNTLYQQHCQKNPHFWTPVDPDYPRLLLQIPNPPPLLYYRGTIDRDENLGNRPVIGIVGTRNPSDYGKRWTQRIATLLAKCGFTIASGMAKGIDTEAHHACLAAGGRTLAVFGTGVDVVYPAENRSLYQQILAQGLALSEYPRGTTPNARHFPQRNRIIAGLSRALLVMEAPERSGALITAHQANEFCRDVYVLPGRIDDYNSQGCLKLLKNGAEMILSEAELLKMLGAMPPLNQGQQSQQLSLFSDSVTRNIQKSDRAIASRDPTPSPTVPSITPAINLEPNLKQVFQVIPSEAIAFDLIVEQARMNAGEVSSALLQLELLGLVSQLPGMRYQRD
ncbi:DNA-processing protein DprA [Planktothricoides raciborskii]|nr:DNA-processing protein DprA [Planktothricoides raciborskii]